VSHHELPLTARQYGEVVLPDASTGHVLWTLARKLSRCKEGMAHFLPSRYKVLWALRVSRYKVDRSRELIPGYKVGSGHMRSVAVHTISKPEISQGVGFKSRADARVRVKRPLQICLWCRSKAKSVTNNLPILSVLALVFYLIILLSGFCLQSQIVWMMILSSVIW